MGNLLKFIAIGTIFEIVALLVKLSQIFSLVVDCMIFLGVMYFIFLAVRGWIKQKKISIPEVMTGKVVRKRHWHLF